MIVGVRFSVSAAAGRGRIWPLDDELGGPAHQVRLGEEEEGGGAPALPAPSPPAHHALQHWHQSSLTLAL